jgi:uncharacterized protein YprB with RNaseH-like and TPR domain
MSDSTPSFKEKLQFLATRAERKEKKKEERKKRKVCLPPEWEQEGEFVYHTVKRIKNPITFSDFSPFVLIPEGITPDNLLFYDIETTGLSGGAGSLFFLIGTGTVIGNEFEIHQTFLSDFPGEPEYLEYVRQLLPEESLYISYNGKSFDSHLIRSRYHYHGMDVTFEHQFDLLHLSRRFWKRLIGACSLCDMEEKVLFFQRVNDISGYEVPDIYFNFLRTADTSGLQRVFSHNVQDIHTLALLLNHILTLSSCSGMIESEKVDMGALGEFLLLKDNQEGVLLLKRAYECGDLRAGKILSLYFKRREQWDEALTIWREMAVTMKSIFAAIELAKFYEHKQREYGEALFWVEHIFDLNLPLEREMRDDLFKRRKRIEEKKRKMMDY